MLTSWRSKGGFAALRFFDADRAAMATPGVSLEISPKRSSTHSWSLDEASFGTSRLIAVERPVAMVAHGRIDDDTVAFVFADSVDLPASFTMNGETMDASSMCLMPERAEIVISTAGHARSIALQISAPVFREESRIYLGHEPDLSTSACMLRPGASRQRQLYRAAHAVMCISERHAEHLRGERIAERLRRLVLSKLFNCLAAGTTDSRVPYQGLIRKTAAFLHEHRGEMIDQWQICQALRVSERVLRRAFAAAYDVSPARFLRLRRLMLARARLRDGPASSVTEVAIDLGFFDLGRFAAEYRGLFRELPSATLKRRAKRAFKST